MKKELTIAQTALKLLSSVPSKDFIESRFSDETGKCCAVGHYQRLTSKDPSDYSTKNCSDMVGTFFSGGELRKLSTNFLLGKHDIVDKDISNVNNANRVNGYTQKKPKARVIALLKDMVKNGL